MHTKPTFIDWVIATIEKYSETNKQELLRQLRDDLGQAEQTIMESLGQWHRNYLPPGTQVHCPDPESTARAILARLQVHFASQVASLPVAA